MDNTLPFHNIPLTPINHGIRQDVQPSHIQTDAAHGASAAGLAANFFSGAKHYGGSALNATGSALGRMGSASWNGVKSAGNAAWNSGSALGSFVAAPLQNKAWGALGGHAAQQMLTCGLPTMLREEAFIEAYNAMLPHLVEQHPYAAVGLQMGVSLASVAAQHYLREPRLARDPNGDEVAVRGHFGLSVDEAAQIKADDVERRANGETEQWPQLVAKHQAASKRVTGQQVMAELMNTGMSIAGAASGNPALTSRVLSTQLRNIAYAYTREPLQAAVSTTASASTRPGEAPNPTSGVNNAHMRTNAAWYTGMTLAMGTLQDALISSALPKGYSVSGPEIRDAQGQRLTGGELHEMAALVSGLRAVCNSAIETADAFLGKHYDNKQVGNSQQFKASLPMKDFERVLDHSIARLSWNNFATGSNLAAQQALNAMTQGKIPSQVSGTLNNIGTAAAFGLTYNMVNQIYQAHGKVRGAVASARPADVEAPPVAAENNPAPAVQNNPAPRVQNNPVPPVQNNLASSGDSRLVELPPIDISRIDARDIVHAGGSRRPASGDSDALSEIISAYDRDDNGSVSESDNHSIASSNDTIDNIINDYSRNGDHNV